MNWKKWILGTTITLSPISSKSQVIDTVKHEPQKPTTEKTISQKTNLSDSTQSTYQIHSIESDSLPNDTLNIDTLSLDSAAIMWGQLSVREKINSCTDQMLIYLTTFEDIRAKAYWEQAGGVTTVGPGFVYINNKRVTRNYRFKNMEALVNTWDRDLQKQGSWLDNYEAYMYEIIDSMRPTNAKELLACQSEICAPFSLVWQYHTKALGSPSASQKLLEARRLYSETGNPIYKNKADSIFERCATQTMKAFAHYKKTLSEEDKEAFRTEYMKWSKLTIKNKSGQPIRDKNGNIVKRSVPSFVARREAEFSFAIGENIMIMGSCPEELLSDSTKRYVDVLELAVGAANTLKNPKTGKLPKDWVDKAQNLKTDSASVRYQKEFPELRAYAPSSNKEDDEKNNNETNPLILFFRQHRQH